jgi:cysteine desulfurase
VALVSVALVGNELGAVNDLAEVAAVVHERAPRAVLHTDASQALSWVDVAEATAAADLVTLASHKCGGPKGIGALVVRDDVRLAPQVVGGGQERGRRAGTQNVPGAAGFAVAAAMAAAEREALAVRAAAWREQLVAAARSVPGAIDTVGDGGVPGIAHLCLPDVESEAVLFLLEQDHDVLAAAGSSCSSGALTVSAAALAVGVPPELARGALRLSVGWSTTDADVAAAAAAIPEVAARLRAHARDGAPA